MIEILNGMHETIRYTDLNQFRMYHNVEAEDYPAHWHMGIEGAGFWRADYDTV